MTAHVVKFTTLAGGTWIEEIPGQLERTGAERVFRFDKNGFAEWASLADVQENGERARWYGFGSIRPATADDFIFC